MANVTIDIPADWSKNDLAAFLKYISRGGGGQATTTTGTKHHCWRNEPCIFWHQDGKEEYQGHCGLGSCTCITAIFNQQNPPRWTLKE